MAEEPLPLPPVTVPGTPIDPPFIICRDADDSQKPEAGEKEAGDKEGPSQRCSGVARRFRDPAVAVEAEAAG